MYNPEFGKRWSTKDIENAMKKTETLVKQLSPAAMQAQLKKQARQDASQPQVLPSKVVTDGGTGDVFIHCRR
jgi:hypothetical protein